MTVNQRYIVWGNQFKAREEYIYHIQGTKLILSASNSFEESIYVQCESRRSTAAP